MAEEKVQTKVKAKGQIQLKMPILNNIDYIDVTRNKQVLKRYLVIPDGMKWREFQELVGKEYGSGKIYYNIFEKNGKRHSGVTNAISMSPEIKFNPDIGLKEVQKSLQELQNKINSKTESFSTQMLIDLTKQGYEQRISYLDIQIVERTTLISKLEIKLDSVERELTEAYETIDSLEGQTGWVGLLNQYKPLIEAGLIKLGAKNIPVTKLSGDIQTSIPVEVLEILAMVDFDKVKTNLEGYNQALSYLSLYVSTLPQKGQ